MTIHASFGQEPRDARLVGKRSKKAARRTALVGAAAALLLAAIPALPASAADGDGTVPMEPYACIDAGTHYSVSAKQDIHIPTGKDWKSGPGGSVTSSIESTQTATTSVSLSATFSVSGIVASAETTFGIDASTSATQAQTYEYSHDIAPGKYGHMQFGNWGWRMSVKQTVINASCQVTSTTSGTVSKMPSANSWGFRYWETAS